MTRTPLELLVAGSIARDDVRTPKGENRNALGGSATYFTLAARLFAPVTVVATAGDDFMPVFEEAMRGTGADLRSVTRSPLPTYHWQAEHDYETGTTRNEHSDQGAYRTFEPVLTADQRSIQIVFLGSMEPRHQLRVLDQLDRPWLVAGDTMKEYIWHAPDALSPVLERLDYLFLNASEAIALSGAETLETATAILRHRYRLRGLIIKEGRRGATLYRQDFDLHLPALPIDPPTDPTGAGDAVAGGFLGYLAERRSEDEASLRRALAYAMVMASFAIEDFGIRGLQRISRPEVEARMASMAWEAQPAS